MEKPRVMTSRRHPLGPQVRVEVTAELITTAVRGHSGHCMVAEAIKAAVPYARKVAVDISTCRFSDPERGLRYVYLTPRVAQDALVDFDEGLSPKPFAFKLRGAHVSRAGATHAKDDKKGKRAGAKLPARAVLHDRDGKKTIPDRVGGRRPPQLHIRREFGLRAFRAASLKRLEAEQHAELEDVEGEA